MHRNVLLIGAVAVLLASCGSSSTNASGSSSTTAGGAAQATSTTASSSSSSPATSSTVPPANSTTRGGGHSISQCITAQLRISAGRLGAAAGHQGLVLLFANSGSTCSMQGYPGVAGLNSAGQQIAQATRTPNGYLGGLGSGGAPPLVSLASGQTASSLVEGTDVPTGGASSCPTYSSLLVTPPGETHSVTVQAQLSGCSGLQVHPVVPGPTGSES